MKILIAIIGSHTQPEQRAAQRDTWLRDLADTDANYLYALGRPYGAEADTLYGYFADGPIRQGGYGWHTPVLRNKVQMMVEYALGRGYDYLFKCDDDTYVRVARLLASGFEAHDYSGFTEAHSAFALGRYRFALGPAYWLSRRAMSHIADTGLNWHHSEDYAVGQALARTGILAHHDHRYKPEVSRAELAAPGTLADYITLHKVDAHSMRQLYSLDQSK